MHFVSFKLFIFNSHFFPPISHICEENKYIYNECITGIYTYSLCIYEYILILSTLVYVRNAKKKKKKQKTNIKKQKKLKNNGVCWLTT